MDTIQLHMRLLEGMNVEERQRYRQMVELAGRKDADLLVWTFGVRLYVGTSRDGGLDATDKMIVDSAPQLPVPCPLIPTSVDTIDELNTLNDLWK